MCHISAHRSKFDIIEWTGTVAISNHGREIMIHLSEMEIRVLTEALDDEYRAWATYDQIIADFGETPPFSNIREAEARHIEALCVLFSKYGLSVPTNPWLGKVERYSTLQAACEAGVAAEIANGEMYDRLLGMTRRQDIISVLRNLQAASQQRHLPAFQRCAQRVSETGARHRRGRGNQS